MTKKQNNKMTEQEAELYASLIELNRAYKAAFGGGDIRASSFGYDPSEGVYNAYDEFGDVLSQEHIEPEDMEFLEAVMYEKLHWGD